MNRSKQKGTAAETAVVNFYRSKYWPNAERRTLSGANDRGDVAGVIGIVTEVKDCKEMNLSGWLKEAERERLNDNADYGVVWHKKRGTTDPGQWYVTMTGDQFAELIKAAGY